jgi:hypothetical protein
MLMTILNSSLTTHHDPSSALAQHLPSASAPVYSPLLSLARQRHLHCQLWVCPLRPSLPCASSPQQQSHRRTQSTRELVSWRDRASAPSSAGYCTGQSSWHRATQRRSTTSRTTATPAANCGLVARLACGSASPGRDCSDWPGPRRAGDTADASGRPPRSGGTSSDPRRTAR